MLAVCFYAEAKSNCGRQVRIDKWASLAQAFDVDRLMVIDRTGFECFDPRASVPVEKYNLLADVCGCWPDTRYVFAEQERAMAPTPLWEYRHPEEDVIYCFGGDVGGFRGEAAPELGDCVVIPTASTHPLWAEQAATIVLADRWRRGDH